MFYKEKEAEYIARSGDLEKRMLAWINSQEAMARQDLPIYDSPLDYLKKAEGSLMAGDHVQSKLVLNNLLMNEGDKIMPHFQCLNLNGSEHSGIFHTNRIFVGCRPEGIVR